MLAKLNERDDMTRLAKHGSLFAALAGAALLACAKADETSQSADSPARNLTLAPTESTPALKDVPAPATEAAKLAPEEKTPGKKPAAPKPAPPVQAAGRWGPRGGGRQGRRGSRGGRHCRQGPREEQEGRRDRGGGRCRGRCGCRAPVARYRCGDPEGRGAHDQAERTAHRESGLARRRQ